VTKRGGSTGLGVVLRGVVGQFPSSSNTCFAMGAADLGATGLGVTGLATAVLGAIGPPGGLDDGGQDS
jgi:hypothetical protein